MIQHDLTTVLFAVAILSLGAGLIGLYARPREFFRGFWFMVGLWGFIDGGIAWFSLLQDPLPPADLKPILALNLGLQLVYIPCGIILATRQQPLLKGFGWGVLASALPLAVIDAIFYWICTSRLEAAIA